MWGPSRPRNGPHTDRRHPRRNSSVEVLDARHRWKCERRDLFLDRRWVDRLVFSDRHLQPRLRRGGLHERLPVLRAPHRSRLVDRPCGHRDDLRLRAPPRTGPRSGDLPQPDASKRLVEGHGHGRDPHRRPRLRQVDRRRPGEHVRRRHPDGRSGLPLAGDRSDAAQARQGARRRHPDVGSTDRLLRRDHLRPRAVAAHARHRARAPDAGGGRSTRVGPDARDRSRTHVRVGLGHRHDARGDRGRRGFTDLQHVGSEHLQHHHVRGHRRGGRRRAPLAAPGVRGRAAPRDRAEPRRRLRHLRGRHPGLQRVRAVHGAAGRAGGHGPGSQPTGRLCGR